MLPRKDNSLELESVQQVECLSSMHRLEGPSPALHKLNTGVAVKVQKFKSILDYIGLRAAWATENLSQKKKIIPRI